jgi:hypothetical protein
MQEVTVAQVDVFQHVVADPSGVALLLAGPAARDLWPVGEARFAAPQRSGLGFVIGIRAHTEHADLRGRVVIAAAGTAERSTQLRLVASVTGPGAARLSAAGETFLHSLAEAARARSSAA